MELLRSDGISALAKAKDRSDQFGQQSQLISSISRDARTQAERLEAQAEANKQAAITANENSQKAYEMAKNTITLQKNIRLVYKKKGKGTFVNNFVLVYLSPVALSFAIILALKLLNRKRNWRPPPVSQTILFVPPKKCTTMH